jgi:hypothetical protein
MKLSVVILSRNDNYGGDLNTRAKFCINTMLAEFDEVVYVDWNTEPGKPPLTDDIDISVNPDRLKVVVVSPADARRVMGEENYMRGQKCCDVLGRNVGIRRATGDYIVSTNIDIICPRRAYIEDMIRQIPKNGMITLARYGVDRDAVKDIHEKCQGDYRETRDVLTLMRGVDALSSVLICPVHKVDKAIMNQVPDHAKFNVASVINNAGDFQVAHRDVWWAVRGFEESQFRRTFTDTQLQHKVIMNGGTVMAANLPPVYHIDHERDPTHVMNERVLFDKTQNSETWGFSNENFPVKKRFQKVIVSLTSIPSRFDKLPSIVEALTHQACHEIWVNIPQKYTRFPDWDGQVPDLGSNSKVKLNRPSEDWGPGTKFIGPALASDADLIVYVDDDTVYDQRLVMNLLKWHRTDPESVWGMSGFKFDDYFKGQYPRVHGEPLDVIEGYGGVIVKAEWVRNFVSEFKELLAVTPMDDIIASNLFAKAGIKRKTIHTAEFHIGMALQQLEYGFGPDALHTVGHVANNAKILENFTSVGKNYFKTNAV